MNEFTIGTNVILNGKSEKKKTLLSFKTEDGRIVNFLFPKGHVEISTNSHIDLVKDDFKFYHLWVEFEYDSLWKVGDLRIVESPAQKCNHCGKTKDELMQEILKAEGRQDFR